MNAVSLESAQLRQTMVDCQLRTFDVTNHAVLARMAEVPREMFLPEAARAIAYSDRAIAVRGDSSERRLLPPMVLARLLQAAAIAPGDKVLCVGGGGGYGAAVAAGLGASAVALENDAGFSALASAGYAALGLANARAASGDLAAGLPGEAPFDVIVMEGAFEQEPQALLGQLAEGGRLLALWKTQAAEACRAVRYEKFNGVIGSQELFGCGGRVLPGFEAAKAFSF
ncbi:MAG: protein-L-isoaspartate O-methyltransferase [Beijerinckiaceae bacterium]